MQLIWPVLWMDSSRDSPASIPAFADLPKVGDTEEHHAWEVFPSDLGRGCLAFIGETEIREATRLVSSGVVINLNLPIGEPQPQFWANRPMPTRHEVVTRTNRDDRLDSFYLQGTTHWDAIRHYRFREFGYFGGRQDEDLESNELLGVDQYASRGILGRGVLLDVAGYLERKGAPLDPIARFPIGSGLLEDVAQHQGIILAKGDVLAIRTGWLGWFQGVSESYRSKLAAEFSRDRQSLAYPGLDPTRETIGWLWDKRIAAVVADNPTLETLPYDPKAGWAHLRMLPLLGMPIGELWVLDELAKYCRSKDRFAFLLTSGPLAVKGGTGSPANAYAVF
jgi:kynurenine formamidase